MNKHLSKAFSSVFSNPKALERLQSIGNHVSVNTFNLATTSLRHLGKWYDRLEDISVGKIRNHGNFVSDPESIGLVRRTSDSVILTNAGQAFLDTKKDAYDNEMIAEYHLVKILFYSKYRLSGKSTQFLNNKRANLLSFLKQCSPFSQSELVHVIFSGLSLARVFLDIADPF